MMPSIFFKFCARKRVSKNWIILLVARLGLLIGTTFSSGMMEVVRKGIFIRSIPVL